MIIAITIMDVFPEKQKEVLQTLISMIEPPGREKGCLSYGIFRDIEDKNVFNLISEWETRKHLNHYMRSDRFRVLLGTKSLLCEPLKIQIFTVLNSEGTEAVDSVKEKSSRKGNIMNKNLEPKNIDQLLAEADELIQQINSDTIKHMKEEHRLEFEIHAQNLKKIKSEVHGKTGKKGTSEIGSGAEGVHEAIDDIVKAMQVMLGTYIKQ